GRRPGGRRRFDRCRRWGRRRRASRSPRRSQRGLRVQHHRRSLAPRGGAAMVRRGAPPMVLDKRQKLFLVLAAVFVTCLVVGDLIGGKLVEANVFGLLTVTLTVGMIPFPVT